MIEKIAIIGAGTMGHSVANHFAIYGYPVKMYMRNPAKVEGTVKAMRNELEFLASEDMLKGQTAEAVLNNITIVHELKDAVADADYILECLAEDIAVKQNLFDEMDKYAKPDAIFASNTSSLSFSAMTEKLSDARKAYTMLSHWYNPGHIMPIVELSFFGNMAKNVYDTVNDLYEKVEKVPVKVLKDVPGLAANRIQQAVAREVFSLMEMGVAEPADIDKALKFGPAFRYATTGQLEVADFGGLDVWCIVGDNLLAVMNNSKEANPILRKKVEEGKLGFKTGEGFFQYPEDKKAEMQNEFNRRLIRQLKTSKNYL